MGRMSNPKPNMLWRFGVEREPPVLVASCGKPGSTHPSLVLVI
jgi:hypothetical protein